MNQTQRNLPTLPYGAVYFRKSNPPREDWERDYAQAARDGMNIFRHWFMWGSIEVQPDVWDFDDYDRQLELAQKYGIQTIIAELTHSAPEWAFRQFAHARYEAGDGVKGFSQMRNSSATGGFPGLCLDNEDARAAAEKWLCTLAARYKGHAALGGYDIWNECNLFSSAMPMCYCAASKAKFREWLRAKYGDLETLGRAWNRFSFADWEDVEPPRGHQRNNEWAGDLFPDFIDWAHFRMDNAYRLMQWRVETIRDVDPDVTLTAHGVHHRNLLRLVNGADNPWRAASLVESYGYTGGCSYYEREEVQWARWSHADMTRSGARGKPFWAAERSAGPNWSLGGLGARDNGRVPSGKDLRLADFTALAGGATGLFSSRWRPLLDGPLFDHYAYYGMDGLPTPRSEMASSIAKWANAPAQEQLWRSRPVRGDIGLLVAPESQIHLTLLRGSSALYSEGILGAYRALTAHNIQTDYVPIQFIDEYGVLYLPVPYALSEATATALKSWVERGGQLISEGPLAYWNDRGRAFATPPGFGLAEVFGVKQESAEFAPDLVAHENSTFRVDGLDGIANGGFGQTFHLDGGTATGWFADGRIAVVDNNYGKGRTRLLGTSPGLGFSHGKSDATRAFFADLLEWAGTTQHVVSPDALLGARLHAGAGGTYLWLVNGAKREISGLVELSSQWGPFSATQMLWGAGNAEVEGHALQVRVPALDALVLKLE